jgi:hypothetical protein
VNVPALIDNIWNTKNLMVGVLEINQAFINFKNLKLLGSFKDFLEE